MPFIKLHKDDDFLEALDPAKLRSAAYVAKKVGCALSTAKASLAKLVAQGAVEKLEIDDGVTSVYRLR